ncbi:MAG: aminotransferase class I/II-fold pyridoxal phosphate-dependent enzyme [Alphaproteobacteria bacterium]|nr:aminotransferase class I/II-fold pyridoxal phosphate-dependent enzyme [Alphaproteobacteria bacterium]
MSGALPAPIRPVIAGFAGSRIREVSKIGMERPGVTALWFGEGDRPTPRFICDAAAQALAAGRTYYTSNSGTPELRQAIARYAMRLHGQKIVPERVTVTASGVNALMLIMQALVDPGDNVVMVTPVWPNCADNISVVLGGEVRRVTLAADERGWRLDLDRLFAACDGRTRAIFVNSPGNPTGWMAGAADHLALREFARKRRIWIVADEVYERIVYDRACAPSALDGASPDDPVIVVNSFSKAWCMTGWRLGWIVHPQALGETLAKLNEVNMSGPAMFAQDAGTVAIEQGEGFIREIVDDYRRAREVVVQRLGAMPRVRLARPEAAFYAFFRVDGMTDSLATAKQVLDRANVGLAPGVAFGPEGEGWLRLCFATSPQRLSDALDRLAPAFA